MKAEAGICTWGIPLSARKPCARKTHSCDSNAGTIRDVFLVYCRHAKEKAHAQKDRRSLRCCNVDLLDNNERAVSEFMSQKLL